MEVKEIRYCHLCKRELDQKDKPDTEDCGGDCLRCMAYVGDPYAKSKLRHIRKVERQHD